MDMCAYLNFNGDCETAFRTYEKILGGKILMMMRHSEMPDSKPNAEWNDKMIMHARLQVGERLLMGSDAPANYYKPPQGFHSQIGVHSPAEAERIFKELSEGGSVQMPITETFWAERFGMLTDKFGIPWMVNCEKQPEKKPEDDKNAFTISRTFDAPRDAVWAAFTDPERMKQWWGPKGAEIIASKMDLRPDGMYLYGMRMPDGKVMWGKMVYREIAKPDRIVFVNSFSDEEGGTTRHPMAPTWPLQMHSTFLFTESNGRTIFTVRGSPLDPTPEERTTFDSGHASLTGGWSGTLDQLESYLMAKK